MTDRSPPWRYAPDNVAAEMMRAVCNTMKPGQRVNFDGQSFRRAFKPRPLSFLLSRRVADDEIDAFLEGSIGSAWGCWDVRHRDFDDVYVIERREGGEKRVYVDPDKRHMFLKLPDGSMERAR